MNSGRCKRARCVAPSTFQLFSNSSLHMLILLYCSLCSVRIKFYMICFKFWSFVMKKIGYAALWLRYAATPADRYFTAVASVAFTRRLWVGHSRSRANPHFGQQAWIRVVYVEHHASAARSSASEDVLVHCPHAVTDATLRAARLVAIRTRHDDHLVALAFVTLACESDDVSERARRRRLHRREPNMSIVTMDCHA